MAMDKGTLDELFSHPAAVQSRKLESFDPRNFYLYGAGTMGRAVLAIFRTKGLEPRGFIDDTPEKKGTQIDGLNVVTHDPSATATVVICVHNPAHDYLKSRLRFGEKTLSFMHLPWLFPDVELAHATHPSNYLSRANDIVAVGEAMADDISRRTFVEQIKFRFSLEWAFQERVAHPYFPPDIGLPYGNCVNFIDAGAYDGDTIRSFRRHFSCPGKVVAIEADPRNFVQLQAFLESTPGEHVAHNAAVGGKSGFLRFDATGNMAARLSPDGQLQVPCQTLEYFMQGLSDPCYIKFDVEGAETEILKNSVDLLSRRMPMLAVSIYHCPMDLIDIPLMLRRIGYDIYIRYHGFDGAELVLYALPPKGRQSVALINGSRPAGNRTDS